MPKDLKRHHENDDLHFVTFSCYHRQPYLQPSSRKDLFLYVLEQVREKYRFSVTGYVLMPEHVHLLSKPAVAPLSVALQVLKQTVSRRVSCSEPHTSLESFWQRRFYDFNVRTRKKRIEKLRYIHQNPVRRGLVQKPEDWIWSSFRHYALGEPCVVTIDSSWLNVWKPDVSPTLAEKHGKDGAPEHSQPEQRIPPAF